MANFEVGESSHTKCIAMNTNEHQRPIEFFTPTTSPKDLFPAYPLSTPNLTFAAPYPNETLNTDLAVFAQGKPHKDCELDSMRGMDIQEWRKERKRQQNRKASRKSKDRKKRELEALQDKVRAIARETTMLREDIMSHSEEIEDLRAENEALLEELRDVCDQETISRLESMDPENWSQVRQASYESDRDNNASPSSDHSYQKTLRTTETSNLKLTSEK